MSPLHVSSRSRVGRPVKSSEPRQVIQGRMVQSQRHQLVAIAQQLEIPLGDYLTYIVAVAHEWEVPSYLSYVDDRVKQRDLHVQATLPLAVGT